MRITNQCETNGMRIQYDCGSLRKKRTDANNESLRNQHNAKPTECEYNFSMEKKRIDANNESMRNQRKANIT